MKKVVLFGLLFGVFHQACGMNNCGSVGIKLIIQVSENIPSLKGAIDASVNKYDFEKGCDILLHVQKRSKTLEKRMQSIYDQYRIENKNHAKFAEKKINDMEKLNSKAKEGLCEKFDQKKEAHQNTLMKDSRVKKLWNVSVETVTE